MNPKELLFEALGYSPSIILSFGLILGVISYSRLENIHRILLLYMLVALIIDILGRVMGHYFNNNLILIPIFGLLELMILSRLYLKHLITIENKYWLIPIGFLILFNLVEIFTLINVDPKDFHCISRVLDALAIVIMCIVFYVKLIANDPKINPSFLFLNSVIFAFQSLNLILYLPINYLINVESNIKFHFWTTSLVLTIIFYIAIIRIIWIHGKTLNR